jgi:hypothetical protein
MFTNGDRGGWLQAVANRIMDGGSSPPSIDLLNITVPPTVSTRVSDGYCTVAAARGLQNGKNLKDDDLKEGWRIIIDEMITLLREQGFVAGNDAALTWMKPLDGTWKVSMSDEDRQHTVFGQIERRKVRDRAVVGERDEITGDRTTRGIFETGKARPLELDVVGPRGGTTKQHFAIHPLALTIPPMTENEREGLRADIEKNGVKIPIVIYEKKILDGRNRAYLASVLNKPVSIMEFKGTGEEARRYVISLNIHRRHLSPLQLGAMAEELYGKKADKMVAEAHRQGSIRGGKVTLNSVQPSQPKRAPQRDDIVANLAKADGIRTTRHVIANVKQLMDAPQTFARVKRGEFHKIGAAFAAAALERGQPLPTVRPEMTPRSVVERLGACIDNLNRILIDCEISAGQKPEKISERLDMIVDLTAQVRQELRKRKMIG